MTPKAGYAHYTLRQAAQDWLEHRLAGRPAKTVTENPECSPADPGRHRRPETPRSLSRRCSSGAGRHGVRVLHQTVSTGDPALNRAIRHAEASDLVARNVAALADTP